MADSEIGLLLDARTAGFAGGTACTAVRKKSLAKGQPNTAFELGSVRYIKLGQNGKWAAEALEKGTIPFGYAKGADCDDKAALADSIMLHQKLVTVPSSEF